MLNWKTILLWFYKLFIPRQQCEHRSVNPFLIKGNYCPDCGIEVFIEWCFLKCADCQSRRSGYYLSNIFFPVERHCRHCGNTDFQVETKYHLDVYDQNFVTYRVKEKSPLAERKSQTRVWLDPGIKQPAPTNQQALLPCKLLPATVSS
jgi:hypothetical protein